MTYLMGLDFAICRIICRRNLCRPCIDVANLAAVGLARVACLFYAAFPVRGIPFVLCNRWCT